MEENINNNQIDLKKEKVSDKDLVTKDTFKKLLDTKENVSPQINVENKTGDYSSTSMEKKQFIEKDTKNQIPVVRVIALDKLVSFAKHPFQTYEGERLEKFAESIQRNGLMYPIIIRPFNAEQFEILSGHNRVKAAKLLGYETIAATIKKNLTDDEAMELVIDSNLHQQSFADWKYSQQLRVIKIHNKIIKEHSQQGKRNDLLEEGNGDCSINDGTCDHSEHKLKDIPKRLKTRDKIAKRLGLSSTTFERYKSIVNLEDDILDIIGGMLDEKKLSFMAAFHLSKLKSGEIAIVVNLLEENFHIMLKPETRIKAKNFKQLSDSSRESETDLMEEKIVKILFLSNKSAED